MAVIEYTEKQKAYIENKKNKTKNQQKIEDAGLICVGSRWRKKKYLCTKCGNIMIIKKRLVIKNPICRNCMTGQSFGEEKAINLLTRYGMQFQKEKTFRGLKGVNGKNLRFDFYVQGKLNPFILEIDGGQHKAGSEWGGNTLEHDIIKNKYCLDKGIRIYRLNYTFGKLQRLEDEIIRVLDQEK